MNSQAPCPFCDDPIEELVQDALRHRPRSDIAWRPADPEGMELPAPHSADWTWTAKDTLGVLLMVLVIIAIFTW